MLKKIPHLLMITAFLIMSLFSANAPKTKTHGAPSSTLTKQEEKEPGITRTYYTDNNGNLTYANNLRYAVYIKIYDENEKLIKEEYYDENGSPSEQGAGYVATTRTYYPDGKLELLTYLGKDNQPVKITSGYAYLQRTYDENTETDWYLDTSMSPVKTTSGYYAYRKTYDENKKLIVMEYLDKEGTIMNNVNGIAIQKRAYDTNGRLATEFYFDKEHNPTIGTYGQYGVAYEYNDAGKTTKTTYLDPSGIPIPTNRGFTILRKIYNEDGSYTEYYYDANDKPIALSRGQYGSRTVNGQIIYVDARGKEIFDLHNYLNYNHQSVMFLGLLILTVSTIFGKIPNIFMFLLYASFIAYMTLLYREVGENRLNFTLFWSYRQYFTSPSLRVEVMNNIWLFVPAGFIIGRITKKPCTILICLIMSIAIEATQYFLGIGLCELDDIFGNTLD